MSPTFRSITALACCAAIMGFAAMPAAAASSAKKQAAADYRAAKKACDAKKGAERRSCRKEAKATYDVARHGTGTTASKAAAQGTAGTAVETQSPAVSATGIAPSPVGPNRTPGKPASAAR